MTAMRPLHPIRAMSVVDAWGSVELRAEGPGRGGMT